MSHWPGTSCNVVFANLPTEVITTFFFFSSKSLINSPPVHSHVLFAGKHFSLLCISHQREQFVSTSTPLSTWLNCRGDVSLNQKDTTDVSHQQSNRLYKGKGSSSASWQSSYTHTGSESESGVWHQVELRNSWCITPRQREPLVRSTALLTPKEANATTSPTATAGLCCGFCFPLVPSWRTSLVAAASPGKPDFFLSQLYNITRTAQVMCCAAARYKYTLGLTLQCKFNL